MFSSQIDRTGRGVMYWATHTDGTSDQAWTLTQAFAGDNGANQHINLKALPQGDPAGLVLAAVKTSRTSATETLTHLLRLRADGSWTSHRFGTVSDNHTRPIVQLDIDNRQVYVFATSACCRGDAIFYKQTALDALSFPEGRGIPFIQSVQDLKINNPTGTKQLVGHTSGVLVLAGDDTTHAYLHNYKAIAPAVRRPAPGVASEPGPSPDPAIPSEPSVGEGAAPSGLRGAGSSTQIVDATTNMETPRNPGLRPDPPAAPARRARTVHFGWFGTFMALTGANILTLVGAATAALLLGIGVIATAWPRVRRAKLAPLSSCADGRPATPDH
jgi:hypothetical protein